MRIDKIKLWVNGVIFVFMVYFSGYIQVCFPESWLNFPNTIFTFFLFVSFIFRFKLDFEQ